MVGRIAYWTGGRVAKRRHVARVRRHCIIGSTPDFDICVPRIRMHNIDFDYFPRPSRKIACHVSTATQKKIFFRFWRTLYLWRARSDRPRISIFRFPTSECTTLVSTIFHDQVRQMTHSVPAPASNRVGFPNFKVISIEFDAAIHSDTMVLAGADSTDASVSFFFFRRKSDGRLCATRLVRSSSDARSCL